MKRKTAYIETTIPSYHASKKDEDERVKTTRKWWQENSNKYQLYISPYVLLEIRRGNPSAAKRREELLKDIPLLPVSNEVSKLTKNFLKHKIFPPKSYMDALHLAIATVNNLDYFVTWNYKHLANQQMIPAMEQVAKNNSYRCPEIHTPQSLLGTNYERERYDYRRNS